VGFGATVILVECLCDQVACLSTLSTSTDVAVVRKLGWAMAVGVRRSTRCCDIKATLPY
jgi:hypothetical protein